MSSLNELPAAVKLAVDNFLTIELPKAIAVQLSATINAKISNILDQQENKDKIMGLLEHQINKSTLNSENVVKKILDNSSFKLSVSNSTGTTVPDLAEKTQVVAIQGNGTQPTPQPTPTTQQTTPLKTGGTHTGTKKHRHRVSRRITHRRRVKSSKARTKPMIGGTIIDPNKLNPRSDAYSLQTAIVDSMSLAIRTLTDKITKGVMDPLIVNVNKHLDDKSLISDSISAAINAQMETILKQESVTKMIIDTTQTQLQKVLSENKQKFADALYNNKCEQINNNKQ
jgi:hypothetical protein